MPEGDRVDFVCERWQVGDPTVAEEILGLDYQVGSATNLLEALTNITEEAGSGALDGDFEVITNRIPANVEAAQFMQLKIIFN